MEMRGFGVIDRLDTLFYHALFDVGHAFFERGEAFIAGCVEIAQVRFHVAGSAWFERAGSR